MEPVFYEERERERELRVHGIKLGSALDPEFPSTEKERGKARKRESWAAKCASSL
jgi:hypothetical protein